MIFIQISKITAVTYIHKRSVQFIQQSLLTTATITKCMQMLTVYYRVISSAYLTCFKQSQLIDKMQIILASCVHIRDYSI